MGIAFTRAMPSIIINVYFGDVSLIPVKPFLVSLEHPHASISWPFSLLEAILVDVSTAGVCMTFFITD